MTSIFSTYMLLCLLNVAIAHLKGLGQKGTYWGIFFCSLLFTPVTVFVVMAFMANHPASDKE